MTTGKRLSKEDAELVTGGRYCLTHDVSTSTYRSTIKDLCDAIERLSERGGKVTEEDALFAKYSALSHAPSPPQQDGSGLVEAAKALKDDLEARAVFDHRLGVKTVAASWSVWKRFTDEIMLAEQSALASTPKATRREKP
jgi:hypothetical protein